MTPFESQTAAAAGPPGDTAVPHAGLARLLLGPCVLVWGALGLGIVARLFGSRVWDDAYVFHRYAGNLLAHGALSWNPGAAPAYGLTSVLFAFVVAAVRVVLPGADASVVAAVASLTCGAVFCVAMGVALDRRLPSASAGLRRGAALVVWLAAGAGVAALAEHCASGMDTTFALCGITAYIAATVDFERRPSRRATLVLGLGGGLLWWVRPDLVLYAVLVPLAAATFGPAGPARRAAFGAALLTLATVALLVAAGWLYFHSPLPLPFYAKAGHLYEPAVYEAHRRDPIFELRGYSVACLPLAGLIAAHIAWSVRRRRRPFSACELGLLGATAVFIVYYAFFVLQISAAAHRFYFPTFPVLIWLAGVSAVRLLEALPAQRAPRAWFADSRTRAQRPAGVVIALAALAAAGIAIPQVRAVRAAPAAGPFFVYNQVRRHYAETWIRRTWFRLDAFSDLPDDVSMATTEFGYPAAMNPRKTIYDLSGLNDTQFAHHGFSADVLLNRYQPDVLFMPWRDYTRMQQQIYSHPAFVADYDAFATDELGTAMGLAIRRGSPHYARLRQIVLEGSARVRARTH